MAHTPVEGDTYIVTHPHGHGTDIMMLLPGTEAKVLAVVPPGTPGAGDLESPESQVILQRFFSHLIHQDQHESEEYVKPKLGQVAHNFSLPMSEFEEIFTWEGE